MMKIVLFSAVLFATAYAGWEYKSDNDNDNGDRFPRMAFPPFPAFPPLPAIPAFPTYPNIQFPNIQFPEIKFPEIKVPEIKIPTLDEVKSQKGNGFHSSYVYYTSDGGATILTNDEGRVRQFTVPFDNGKPKSKE